MRVYGHGLLYYYSVLIDHDDDAYYVFLQKQKIAYRYIYPFGFT